MKYCILYTNILYCYLINGVEFRERTISLQECLINKYFDIENSAAMNTIWYSLHCFFVYRSIQNNC